MCKNFGGEMNETYVHFLNQILLYGALPQSKVHNSFTLSEEPCGGEMLECNKKGL